jgi:hypothetical protein
MIRKGQLRATSKLRPAQQFYSLAAQSTSLFQGRIVHIQNLRQNLNQYGKIRLLIDASGFNGWETIAAFENHAGFIKNHHQKIERIAVIATHDWQHWVISAVRMFLHPEVRADDKSQEAEALQWIVG